MKLVEVIPGLDTDQETIDDVVMFAESLRKLPVVVQECPGFFTLMDMLGLDVCAHVGAYLYSEYGERMSPAPLFEELVEAGRMGEKSGVGFFDHPGGESDTVNGMIAELQESGQVSAGTTFSVERLMYPLINEAALCVQENIASITDIDMSMIAGTGMTYGGERVGPLAIADKIGLDAVVDTLETLAEELGSRFRPSRPLKLRVRAGHLGEKAGKGFHEYA